MNYNRPLAKVIFDDLRWPFTEKCLLYLKILKKFTEHKIIAGKRFFIRP